MSSKDDKISKEAEELYRAIHGTPSEKPDWNKSMEYALSSGNEDLVKSLVKEEQSFASPEKVMNVLKSYIENRHNNELAKGLLTVAETLAAPNLATKRKLPLTRKDRYLGPGS
jgi:hypothetical protein